MRPGLSGQGRAEQWGPAVAPLHSGYCGSPSPCCVTLLLFRVTMQPHGQDCLRGQPSQCLLSPSYPLPSLLAFQGGGAQLAASRSPPGSPLPPSLPATHLKFAVKRTATPPPRRLGTCVQETLKGLLLLVSIGPFSWTLKNTNKTVLLKRNLNDYVSTLLAPNT